MTNRLWKKLLDTSTLKKGWHICRRELYRDFAEDLMCEQIYAPFFENFALEIRNRLLTDTYRPEPLFSIEVPKGNLGYRPGSVISIQDRVVLCSIIYLLANELDSKLPDGVRSFRLKEEGKDKGSIFEENRIENIPFLKSKTISKYIDPFEAWYQAWPAFDVESRTVFKEYGYKYLATSDIAAYFENIQLPILRDFLISQLNNEEKIISLLISFLEFWAQKTPDGRPRLRGIPQGSCVTSFLGNIFLMPLDQELINFENEGEVKYFRYMDDVRIFTKSYKIARDCVLQMTRVLRGLHLNVQTAKTKIYNEDDKNEISNHLIDERIDKVNNLIDSFDEMTVSPDLKKNKELELKEIASLKNKNIYSSKKAYEGLDMRFFLRWVQGHINMQSAKFFQLYWRELKRSNDPRLLKKLPLIIKRFPRHTSVVDRVSDMVINHEFSFDYQIAEALRALRYASKVPDEIYAYACRELFESDNTYLRMQCAYINMRKIQSPDFIDDCVSLINKEPDSHVQVATALLCSQWEKIDDFIIYLDNHHNSKLNKLGRLYRSLRTDVRVSRDIINGIFSNNHPHVVCDKLPLIYVIASSKNSRMHEMLHRWLSDIRSKNHPLLEIRNTLSSIRAFYT